MKESNDSHLGDFGNVKTFFYVFLLVIVMSVIVILIVDHQIKLSEREELTIEKKELVVRPGQVWRYTVNTENPFESPVNLCYRVLDVKGKYVKYVRNDRDTSSMTIRYFLVGSVLDEDVDTTSVKMQ